jgi:monoamine oxidase
MSRTPLFAALRGAMSLAAATQRAGAPPLDELADPARLGRRRLLAGAGAALLAPALPVQARLAGHGMRIAVVGGGLAGLVAAHRLVEAGAGDVTLYEANTRVGGRMLSGRDLVSPGTVVELGGSFINADHADVLALAREFGLAIEDGAAEAGPPLLGTFFIGGQHRSIAEIAAEAAPLLPRIEAMRDLPEEAKVALDRRSAAAVMDGLGIDGWLRRLLDIGLTQEMGLEPDRMSGLYFTESFAPDPRQPQRGLFSSDQRFQVAGGNDRLPAAIAARLGTRVRTGYRLLALRRQGSAHALVFDRGGATREVTADIVILAIPLTVLRQVELDIGAPPLTHRAIREVTYGTNAKLVAGLAARPWRAEGRSGECLNDLGIQTVWEDHAAPGTGAGTMTIFAGGRTGVEFARGRAADRARDALAAMDAALPGAGPAFNGRASRMNWPGNPYVGGSYSCFAPGQITGFADAFAPVGRVIFAGEHTSEHSGYMDGAAESGRRAAELVARRVAHR